MHPKIKITPELVKKLKKLKHAELDEFGREMLNPDQLEVPAGLEAPLSLQERMARVFRQEFSKYAEDTGQETYEESQDFDTGEDEFWEDMSTPYTLMQEDEPSNDTELQQDTEQTSSEQDVTEDVLEQTTEESQEAAT